MYLNQNGMSLIQVMVGLGLMSVIGLGVAELMVTSAKIQQRSDVKVSQLILLNEMQSIISNEDTCTTMVSAVNQTYNQAQAQSTNGWDIKFQVAPGEVYKTDYPFGNNLKIKRLYLNQQALVGSTAGVDTYRGKLTMDFETTAQTIGGALQSKEIGFIYYDVDSADKLVGCAKIPETPANKICEDMGGEYNYSKKSCSKFKYADCTSPSLAHGASTTQNYSSGGRSCYRTFTCVDGNPIKTTDFCEQRIPDTSSSSSPGSECNTGASRQDSYYQSSATLCTSSYKCIYGYWALINQKCGNVGSDGG